MAPLRHRPIAFVFLLLFASAVHGEPPPRSDAHGDPLPVGALARLGTTRFRDANFVNNVVLAPDGKTLAAAGNQGIQILELATGKELRTLKSNAPVGFGYLGYAPDGTVLGAADHTGRIQFWDPATGNALGQIMPVAGQPGLRVGILSFSGDGKYVAVGGDNLGRPGFEEKGHVTIYEVAGAKQTTQVEVQPNQNVRAILSPDSKMMATFGNYMGRNPAADRTKTVEVTRTIEFWDPATGKALRTLRDESGGNFASVAFSPDSKQMVVSTGVDFAVWDLATGKVVRRFAGRRGLGAFLSYSPDGKILAAGSYYGPVQTWDAATGRRLGLYEVPYKERQTSRVTFTRDGRLLTCTSNGQAIQVWDVFAEKWVTPVGGHQAGVSAIGFAADGRVVSVSWDGTVCTWDMAGKEVRRQALQDGDAPRFGVGFDRWSGAQLSPEGKHVLVRERGSARLFELTRGRETCYFPGSFNPQGAASAFSPDGGLLAVAGMDRQGQMPVVRLYDLNTGQELRRLEAPAGNELRCLIFAPEGKAIVAAANNRQAVATYRLQAWDPATGKERWHADGAQAFVLGVAYTPDGKTLAALEQSGALILHDAASGRELRRLGTGAVNANMALVAFSPDGRLLAIAASDVSARVTHIRLYEVASGTVRHDFAGHNGQVSSLAFSPDGKRLATGGNDTTVLLWDLTGAAEGLIAKEKPRGEELDKLWATLGDTNARAAFEAMCRMEAAPAETVALLAKHIKPEGAKGTDEATTAKLIAALDADSFDEREKAARDLAALGKAAQPALKKALATKPSAEARRHITGLLERMTDTGPAPDLLRPLRAVELLERLATPDAKKLLGKLGEGQADAPLPVAAKEALGRLERAGKP
jgi:WD40 repeat protein